MADDAPRVVSASRDVEADAATIFELIADPSQQPRWDGNDNLAEAEPGQRVHRVGDVFLMTNQSGRVRANHVVEFEEGRRIAWLPSPTDEDPPGHRWGWELDPLEDGRTRVTHTYDWSALAEGDSRVERARATSSDRLLASIDRLKTLAEGD
jgi:uncharacterized protein YndB with AHSA1/START domain